MLKGGKRGSIEGKDIPKQLISDFHDHVKSHGNPIKDVIVKTWI